MDQHSHTHVCHSQTVQNLTIGCSFCPLWINTAHTHSCHALSECTKLTTGCSLCPLWTNTAHTHSCHSQSVQNQTIGCSLCPLWTSSHTHGCHSQTKNNNLTTGWSLCPLWTVSSCKENWQQAVVSVHYGQTQPHTWLPLSNCTKPDNRL